MNFISRTSKFNPFAFTFVRFYSYSSDKKTHYEVLNLSKSCTEKDIKDAFVKLSKKYHPDINKDVKAKDKFVRILEAYNILGKPGSRAQYDSMISVSSAGDTSYVYRTHVPYNLRKNPQYSYYYEQNSNSNNHYGFERPRTGKSQPYYGVNGIHKVSNTVILLICVCVALTGVCLQILAIRGSFKINRQRSDMRTKMLAEELDRVRTAAKENGNEVQIRLMLDTIADAANPNTTTATLGQALANERKETLMSEFGSTELFNEFAYEIPKEPEVPYDFFRNILSYFTSR